MTSLRCTYGTKHQSSASLAFVRGIHRWPVNSPHKGSVTRKKFPLDEVIMWRLWRHYDVLTEVGEVIRPRVDATTRRVQGGWLEILVAGLAHSYMRKPFISDVITSVTSPFTSGVITSVTSPFINDVITSVTSQKQTCWDLFDNCNYYGCVDIACSHLILIFQLTHYPQATHTRHQTRSALVQVMACRLFGTTHYRIQCWFLSSGPIGTNFNEFWVKFQ